MKNRDSLDPCLAPEYWSGIDLGYSLTTKTTTEERRRIKDVAGGLRGTAAEGLERFINGTQEYRNEIVANFEKFLEKSSEESPRLHALPAAALTVGTIVSVERLQVIADHGELFAEGWVAEKLHDNHMSIVAEGADQKQYFVGGRESTLFDSANVRGRSVMLEGDSLLLGQWREDTKRENQSLHERRIAGIWTPVG